MSRFLSMGAWVGVCSMWCLPLRAEPSLKPVAWSLEPGWNLVPAPLLRESFWALGRGKVWPAQGSDDLPRFAVEPPTLGGDSSGGGTGFWVHVDERRVVDVAIEEPVGMAPKCKTSWCFVSVATPTVADGRAADRLVRWNVQAKAYEVVDSGDVLLPGNGYLALKTGQPSTEPRSSLGSEEETETTPGRVLLPPVGLFAGRLDEGVTLVWKKPTLFSDGREIPQGTKLGFRIYRDGQRVASLGPVEQYKDAEPEAEGGHVYQVSAVMEAGTRVFMESERSQPFRVEAAMSVAHPEPGQFERPEPVVESGAAKALVEVALSAYQKRTLAHLVYVKLGAAGEGLDEVRYARSDQAGKAESFGSFVRLSRLEPGWSILELTVAAREHRVSVAWVEQARSTRSDLSPGTPRARLRVALSEDGGQSFGALPLVRASTSFVRGLSMGYDPALGHHLVWGEANKVYYLRNLTGEPTNVFDVERPMPVGERVKYLTQVLPDDDGRCVCSDCWCPESYRMGHQVGDDAEDETLGSGVRTEQSYVYQPSLHVGDDAVSIAARQTRMWDNLAVPNPAWLAMLADPVYSETVVERNPPARFVVGWKKTWKNAYEPGDERLFEDLGIRFQYRYRGSWHLQDEIKVAHLSWSGASSEASVPPRFQVVTAAVVGHTEGDDTPSHPQLASTPWGLALVYENGDSSNPNTPGQNPIQFQLSRDSGLTWSRPRTLSLGYLPRMGAMAGGVTQVLYYVPDAPSGGLVHSVEVSAVEGVLALPRMLNEGPVKPIHWKGHGSDADSLIGRVSVASYEDLLAAAWIERSDGGSQERIVVARASSATEVTNYGVTLPEYFTEGRGSTITVTAQNVYHMAVDSDEDLQVLGASGSSGALGPVVQGADNGPAAVRLPLVGGRALAWVHPTDVSLVGPLGEVSLASLSVSEGPRLAGVLTPAAPVSLDQSVPTFAATTEGNYEKAKWMRDRLWRESGDGMEAVYQVEYHMAPEASDAEETASQWLSRSFDDAAGQREDASFLARFERVWAYTQGIALAQLARQPAPEDRARAQKMAKSLCEKAQRGEQNGQPVIKGWPFSWNTDGDDWKDVRLVTGATAWVVHGLGSFLVSKGASSLTDSERVGLQQCYRRALLGLEAHRWSGTTDDGLRVSLMTAGWTAEGLNHAARPWNIVGPTGERMAAEDEAWDYYDVLDALGYDTFDAERSPVIARTGASRRLDPSASDSLSLSEAEFWHLKREVQAHNVVTEHNVDVLAVLNHAIGYAHVLGLQDKAHLEAWRDEVQDALFYVLWDDSDRFWRRDLESALAKAASDDSRKEAEIQTALDEEDWGRVATGGALALPEDLKAVGRGEKSVPGGLWDEGAASHVQLKGDDGALVFARSEHVAIDNCSWLSLAVNHTGLKDVYVDRLARCLSFTVLAFAKRIRFANKAYYGAHYFLDGFEDRYIAQSHQQEQSFHLEATTGLILGLRRFAEHHPQRAETPFFEAEADRLWAGVQAFVTDHGFPYSSQRILDLSTLLTSSTALIWFIDVYEDRHGLWGDPQRPLRHYARGVDAEALTAFVDESYRRLKALVDPHTKLIRSGGPKGVPFTRLEDQAMAIVVAVNRGDWSFADGLVRAVLETRRPYEWPGPGGDIETHHEFPAVLHTTTGEALYPHRKTGMQMAAYYALLWYLKRDIRVGTAVGPLAEAVVKEGVPAMMALYLQPGVSRLQDLFLPGDGDQPRGVPRVATGTETNVWAYFVLQLWQASSFKDALPELGFRGGFAGFSRQLSGLCQQELARAMVGGRGTSASWVIHRPPAKALCSLFLADSLRFTDAQAHLESMGPRAARPRFLVHPQGDPEDWMLSEEDLSRDREGRGEDARYAFYLRSKVTTGNLWGNLAGEGLVQRALAAGDARQDEFALEALHWLYTLKGESAFYHVAVQLLNDPAGVFGVRAPSLTLAGMGPDGPSVFLEGGGAQLKQAQRDAVRTLLVTPYRIPSFDVLLERVAFLLFAETQLAKGVDPAKWPRNYVRDRKSLVLRADAALLSLCEWDFLDKVYTRFERFFGLSCGRAEALYAALGDARVGAHEGSLADMVLATDVTDLVKELRVLLSRGVLGGEVFEARVDGASSSSVTEGPCITCGLFFARVDVPEDAPVPEVQSALRTALVAGFDEAFAARLKGGFGRSSLGLAVSYRFGHVDVADALNPRAPIYWGRDALIFRTVLEHDRDLFVASRDRLLHFDGPLPPDRAQNVRTLRAYLNQTWDGTLLSASQGLGVAPTLLHRVIQTGVFPKEGDEAWPAWHASDLGRLQPSQQVRILEATEGHRVRLTANECRGLTLAHAGKEALELRLSAQVNTQAAARGEKGGAVVVVEGNEAFRLGPQEEVQARVCLQVPKSRLADAVQAHGPLSPTRWTLTVEGKGARSDFSYMYPVDLVSGRSEDWRVKVGGATATGVLQVMAGGCRWFEVFNNRAQAMDWDVRVAGDQSAKPFDLSVQEVLRGALDAQDTGRFQLCTSASDGSLFEVGPVTKLGSGVEILVAGDAKTHRYEVEVLQPSVERDGRSRDQADLVGHWPLDGHGFGLVDGQRAHEAVARGFVPSWIPAWQAQGLPRGHWLDVPLDASELWFKEGGEAFSVSVWLQLGDHYRYGPHARDGAPEMFVGTLGPAGLHGSGGGWALAMGKDRHLAFHLRPDDAEPRVFRAAHSIEWWRSPGDGHEWAGRWAHVAVTWNGRGTAAMFVNGKELMTELGSSAESVSVGRSAEAPIRLGWSWGGLDDLRLYRGVLSLPEVEALAFVPPRPADLEEAEAFRVMLDFEDARDDADWQAGPEGRAALAFGPVGQSRALIYRVTGEGALGQAGARGPSPLVAFMGPKPFDLAGMNYVSFDMGATGGAWEGGSVSMLLTTTEGFSWSSSGRVVDGCTRIVHALGTGYARKDVFLPEFWFTPPPGAVLGGLSGAVFIDNVVAYPQGVTPPPSGLACDADGSLFDAARARQAVDTTVPELGVVPLGAGREPIEGEHLMFVVDEHGATPSVQYFDLGKPYWPFVWEKIILSSLGGHLRFGEDRTPTLSAPSDHSVDADLGVPYWPPRPVAVRVDTTDLPPMPPGTSVWDVVRFADGNGTELARRKVEIRLERPIVSPTPEEPPEDEVVAGAVEEKTDPGAIVWGPCDDDEEEVLECGRLAVPLDYDDPLGDQIELGVARLRKEERPDKVLFVHPGGPGLPVIDFLKDGISQGRPKVPEAVMSSFDLVAFDPRGVGQSTPMDCGLVSGAEVPNRFGGEGVVSKVAQAVRLHGYACEKKYGRYMSELGTMSGVEDMERVRDALGATEISFLGYSYAGLLGAAYADRYPQRVRAMVLDAPLGQGLDDEVFIVERVEAMQATFELFVSYCQEEVPGCPDDLGTQLTELHQRLLHQEKHTWDAFEEKMSGFSVHLIEATLWAGLAQGPRWRDLAEVCIELVQDRVGNIPALSGLAQLHAELVPDEIRSPKIKGAHSAHIHCLDRPALSSSAAVIELDRRLQKKAPIFHAHMTVLGAVCRGWPATPNHVPTVLEAGGAGPIMVVGGEHDSSAPFVWAEHMAETLKSGFLVRSAHRGHTIVFKEDACVGDAVTRFLLDPSQQPKDLRCGPPGP